MRSNKIIIFIYIFMFFMIIGCENTTTEAYNSNVQVRGLTLKTSIIQTAYEIYNVNIKDPESFNKELYSEVSKDALKHYKWLKKTYSQMDENMISSLQNIFLNYDQWDYLNETISLDDNADINEIIDKINNSSDLDLSINEKENIYIFFNSFNNEYFKSYYSNYKKKYDKNAKALNNKFTDENVDIINFMEKISGVKFNQNYKSVFYYSLNPFQTQVFKHNNIIISTVQLDTNAQDILSICFYQYSQHLFDSFVSSDEFSNICEVLKQDSNFVDEYNKIGKSSYDFNTWCKENLVAGFSKYLDYKYCQSDYQFTSYTYDLDFYNYLRSIGFNSNKMNLKDVSIAFYKDKTDALLVSSKN